MLRAAIREATPADLEAILALLPRLAAFDVPARRNPRHLWEGDAEIVCRWARGEAPDRQVLVAVVSGEVRGVSVVTLRPELLSGEPSAHLEAFAVHERAEGAGIGSRLLAAAEREARKSGARSMTLHVFKANARALAVYEKNGYEPEVLRCIKDLADTS